MIAEDVFIGGGRAGNCSLIDMNFSGEGSQKIQ